MQWAFVFPGQGSQRPGMGAELRGAFPAARAVFDEVDDALSRPLSRLVLDGPAETLALTENAQPAIMATSLAAVRALEAEIGRPVGELAAFVAGHSLGEYSALAAAGAIGVADCARLLEARGKAMQAASPPGEGAMAALLGLDAAAVESLLPSIRQGGVCDIANDNAPGQVTLSGDADAVARAIEACSKAGARRAVRLAVSAPFHCPLMKPAVRAMQPALARAGFGRPIPPLVANVTARPVSAPEEISALLVDQITDRVRWRESVAWMAASGIGGFVECGAGKVLSGLIRRIAPEAATRNVEDPASVLASAKAVTS